MAASRIRVMLVDDQPILLRALSCFLQGFPDIEIAGQARDGFVAVELARRLVPDVIIMDISMPGMNGIDATHAIHTELPQVRVVGFSTHEGIEVRDAMCRAGGAAYVSKAEPPESLLGAIRDGFQRSNGQQRS